MIALTEAFGLGSGLSPFYSVSHYVQEGKVLQMKNVGLA